MFRGRQRNRIRRILRALCGELCRLFFGAARLLHLPALFGGIISGKDGERLAERRAERFAVLSAVVEKDGNKEEDAADRHAVAYCMTTGNYTQTLKEQSPTLMARDYKDPPVVNETEPEYIVRRLTPTECARLQGFPDWWCAGLGTDEPSNEEIEFWTEVFETHRLILGTSSRPKSRNQIIKWLKNPHSDSAEYKMWGNGVALPNICFVLSGIVYYAQLPEG